MTQASIELISRRKLREHLQDFISRILVTTNKFAPIDFSHYLNRKGVALGDTEILLVLRDNDDLVKETPTHFEKAVTAIEVLKSIANDCDKEFWDEVDSIDPGQRVTLNVCALDMKRIKNILGI